MSYDKSRRTVQIELHYNTPAAMWGGDHAETRVDALAEARDEITIDGSTPDFYAEKLPRSEQNERLTGSVFAHHVVVEVPTHDYGELNHKALSRACEVLKRHTTAPFEIDSCDIEHRRVEIISFTPKERHLFDWQTKQ